MAEACPKNKSTSITNTRSRIKPNELCLIALGPKSPLSRADFYGLLARIFYVVNSAEHPSHICFSIFLSGFLLEILFQNLSGQ